MMTTSMHHDLHTQNLKSSRLKAVPKSQHTNSLAEMLLLLLLLFQRT
jgi:hypothetical protein